MNALRNSRPNARDLVAPPSNDPADKNGGAPMMPPAGQTGMQIKTQYMTAVRVQVPRDLDTVRKNVLKEAAFEGESFFYQWTVKSKQPDGSYRDDIIEGMSIDGAMIVVRNWGNCALEISDQEGVNYFKFLSTFVDAESGFTLQRLFRQRKSEKHGKFDAERALDIAYQIGQSKAQRNVIDKAAPSWLIRDAMAAAKEAAAKLYEDPKKARALLDEALKYFELKAEEIEKKVGKPLAEFKPRDHVLLHAIFRAIDDGTTTLAEEFPLEATTPAAEAKVVETTGDPVPATAAPPQPTIVDVGAAVRADEERAKAAQTTATTPAAKPTREPGDDTEPYLPGTGDPPPRGRGRR